MWTHIYSSHLILSHFISIFDLMDFFFSSIYSFLHLDFSTKIFVLNFFVAYSRSNFSLKKKLFKLDQLDN